MEGNVARAARKRQWAKVRRLVEQGGNVNDVDNTSYRTTALHFAAACGNSDIISFLLSRGANVSQTDCSGYTPLHEAAYNHGVDICQLLVDHKADVTSVNTRGETLLHRAVVCWPDSPPAYHLITNESVNVADRHGDIPLHIAARNIDIETVQLLVDCGADAACSKRDCPEVCVMLIAKGAQVNATDGNGDTSLQVACQKGNMKSADVLVENDGDCNVLNVCGETLLHLACKSRVECVELCDKLISHGVNPHIADREGNLPLHVAFKNRLAKTFGWLFEQLGYSTLNDLEKVNIGKEDLVANLDSANEAGDTRLCHHILELIAKLDTSKRFSLSALNCRSRSGYLLLHTAIEQQDFTLCQYLIDHGASVNAEVVPLHNDRRRIYNEHPLHLAAELGDIDLCRLLIEHGAIVDAEMKGGRTALHLAIVKQDNNVAQLLMSHGADLRKVVIGKESAVKRSEKRGNLKMASIIQAFETFPEEIVSQGEAALRIYLSSCDEGSAVNVFLRVDVVGRDGAGKTSLTKSLTLQKFNRDEPSTRGVVFDPKCQIIVKEACDWTNPLTSADYTEIYEKNVVINMADTLDTPQVKDQYFKSKEGQPPKRQKRSRVASKSSKQDSNMQAVSVPFTDDIEVAKSQESQVDFVQQSPIPSPIMNAIESLTQDLDLQSFPAMSEDDIESSLYHGVDSSQMSSIHSPVINPMLSVAIATNERSDDVSSLLSETQQTISAVSEPPQLAASDMQQSLQMPLNLSTCKDSNIFPPNTATEWQSPSGTNMQVVSACSTSHEQLERDSMDVDKSVEDERDSNSIVTSFGSRLPSSQQEREQQPKKQRVKKRKRKAVESASSFQEIEYEGIRMSDGSKCQNITQPKIKKTNTTQSVIRNTDVLSSDNQDMQQQQQQQQEGTKVNRKKQTKASSSQSEETLPLNVDESSTENTTTLPQHIQERVSKSLRD
ncbi:ankycorbin-like, partial [Corticium candelabrum]|uniref:ankycorbin-like n=1 Tax=Corticium candelabrum TaxID=121492 RepID=UPI002E2720D0